MELRVGRILQKYSTGPTKLLKNAMGKTIIVMVLSIRT